MGVVRVYDPTAPSSIRGTRPAPRLSSLQGKVVGILDNSKANAGLLMCAIADELKAHYGVREVIVHKKQVNGPASALIVNDFKSRADFVLAGSAD